MADVSARKNTSSRLLRSKDLDEWQRLEVYDFNAGLTIEDSTKYRCAVCGVSVGEDDIEDVDDTCSRVCSMLLLEVQEWMPDHMWKSGVKILPYLLTELAEALEDRRVAFQ